MELSIILLWVLLLLLLLLLDAKSFWKHSLARRSLEGQSRKAPACQVGRQTREGVWPPDTVGARSLGEESWAWTQAPPGAGCAALGLCPLVVPSSVDGAARHQPSRDNSGHTLPREAQKVLNRGFLPPPW